MVITGEEDEPACAFSDKCSWDIGEPDFDWFGEFDFDYNVFYCLKDISMVPQKRKFITLRNPRMIFITVYLPFFLD